jgi:hypothetical protein
MSEWDYGVYIEDLDCTVFNEGFNLAGAEEGDEPDECIGEGPSFNEETANAFAQAAAVQLHCATFVYRAVRKYCPSTDVYSVDAPADEPRKESKSDYYNG